MGTGAGDRRSVTTDALDTLGFIISPNEKRDAIHLAVEPVTAGQTLRAGEHVELRDNKAYRKPVGKGVGIVDPFLVQDVEEGEMFWLVIYPRQIRSLRHVWEHPSFPASQDGLVIPEFQPVKPKEESVAKRTARIRIESIAEDLGVTYEELMGAARRHELHGDYWVEGGRFEGHYIKDEFWTHYYAINDDREYQEHGNFLSCSC
jgi:hypothetical protein